MLNEGVSVNSFVQYLLLALFLWGVFPEVAYQGKWYV